MSDTAAYNKAPTGKNTNTWMMTGVVITSPSTGELKAVMPMFNAYSDIRVDSIRPIDPALVFTEETHVSADLAILPVPDMTEIDLHSSATLSEHKAVVTDEVLERSPIMKNRALFDMQHLSVMIGLASLAGAATNIIFNAVSGTTAPQLVVISISVIGFICGRFLSEKLSISRHG